MCDRIIEITIDQPITSLRAYQNTISFEWNPLLQFYQVNLLFQYVQRYNIFTAQINQHRQSYCS